MQVLNLKLCIKLEIEKTHIDKHLFYLIIIPFSVVHSFQENGHIFMATICYLIANSISCSRLFFGQILSAFLDHLRESPQLVLPENSYQKRSTNQSPMKLHRFRTSEIGPCSILSFLYHILLQRLI